MAQQDLDKDRCSSTAPQQSTAPSVDRLFFVRDVTPEDWVALPRAFDAGEAVERFTGHTYGLDRDDLLYGGFETIPCTTNGLEGFFTVPVGMLADKDGKQPRGAYVSVPPTGPANDRAASNTESSPNTSAGDVS